MRRFISYLLVCIIFFGISAGGGVLAANSEPISYDGYDYIVDISPCASQFLAAYNATARRTGSGLLSINFSVDAMARFERVGVLTINIQHRSGNTWRTVTTLRYSTTSGMIGRNVMAHDGVVTHNGTVGMEYRATVTFFAGNVTGDQRNFTTNSVIL